MINEIILSQFKKHNMLKLKINSKICIFSGANASGKTSILEGINMLYPGKGIFNTNMQDLVQFNESAFEVFINSQVKTHISYAAQNKQIKVNSEIIKPLKLLEYFRIYGITPYIAFAFWKDSSVKRKQIDRLIMQNEPTFAIYYNKYTKALKEYNALFEVNRLNKSWENALMPIIVENGKKITQIRHNVLEKIKNNINDDIVEFLGDKLAVDMKPSLEAQFKILDNLKHGFEGPHRTKFELRTNNYQGSFASTGQQKKLLLALTIMALPHNESTENILLLDDLFSQLDDHTQKQLIAVLNKQQFQTFVTNIEEIKKDYIQNIKIGT